MDKNFRVLYLFTNAQPQTNMSDTRSKNNFVIFNTPYPLLPFNPIGHRVQISSSARGEVDSPPPPLEFTLTPIFWPKKWNTLKHTYNSRLYAKNEPSTIKIATVRAISKLSPISHFSIFMDFKFSINFDKIDQFQTSHRILRARRFQKV